MDSVVLRFYAYIIFALFIAAEVLYFRARRERAYGWKTAAASIAVSAGQIVATVLTGLVLAGVYYFAYENRLWTIPMDSAWSWIGLFFGLEFFYYWFHRWSHEIRWMWASHGVHHSSDTMHFPAALRLGWTGLFSGVWLFWIPLILIGFPPKAVLGMFALNLFYQFFLHTEAVGRLGPLEWVLNTPSHHRVHHAMNPAYLDRNYGGVLILFDRLFGTFAVERRAEPCLYGIVARPVSHNPFQIALGEWVRIGRDLLHARSWRERLFYAFGPPGWRPDGTGLTTAAIRRAAAPA